jgi:hypothetical protein
MYSHMPYFLYIALLLRRRGVLWWRLLLGVRSPWSYASGKMVSFPLLSPFLTCNKIRCNNQWLCCLFQYLSLYVWNLILAHIKECIQFWPKNWVWHITLTGCATPSHTSFFDDDNNKSRRCLNPDSRRWNFWYKAHLKVAGLAHRGRTSHLRGYYWGWASTSLQRVLTTTPIPAEPPLCHIAKCDF